MKLLIITGLIGLCSIHCVQGYEPGLPLLKMMQSLTNTTDFCQLLDIDEEECIKVMTESQPQDGVDENGEKMVVSGGATSEIAGFDPCNPRMSTITIPRHPDNDITVWPTCTRVKRCGGCCTSDVFSCEPTEIRERYVKVFDTRLPYVGAHRFQFLGVRAIKIIEHVHCDAQCKTKSHECHKYQIYESRKCRCVCHPQRLKLMSTCRREQIWDDSECDCICPNRNTVNCPEPSYFSTTTCKCTLKTEVTGEIDLDLLISKLDLAYFDFANKDLKDIIKIGRGPFKDNITYDIDDTSTSSTQSTTSTTTSSTTSSTTPTTTTTTTTTTTPAPTKPKPKANPCANKKCFFRWRAIPLKSGKCQCIPPIG